ncbi:LytTR family transcriptional regulator [Pedobacter lusitanus]|uniref:LytTR family transcriptional regulator n=1 Tax=Pedobacter lusitanus TaxID=1503925 RepID=A0A0D0F9X0_9SPHI|nr:LytTR family DNA-binding domain-containing protein [Pedobacter lusitanus]KIO78588.1 LytTR family transcriptional regulator [Pedobacter lusitanus]
MLSVLIIEDEIPNALRLKEMLIKLDNTIQITGQLHTIRASIQWLSENEHPDLICMDIRLTDGLSFELFNQVKIQSQVIFITAYDEYALRAFEVNGIDYLLKPLEAAKLENSIRKVKNMLGKADHSGMPEILQKIEIRDHVYRSRFLVAYRDMFVPVVTTDIAYFSSENKKNYLTTHQGQRYMIEQTLEELEHELNPQDFFRVSRQYIVSVRSIHKIYQSFNGKLKIELVPANEDSILVSRDKSASLKKWLNSSF